jgi:hypothetical protein
VNLLKCKFHENRFNKISSCTVQDRHGKHFYTSFLLTPHSKKCVKLIIRALVHYSLRINTHIKKVIPNYAKIKIPYIFHAKDISQQKAQTIRLKDEIKKKKSGMILDFIFVNNMGPRNVNKQ